MEYTVFICDDELKQIDYVQQVLTNASIILSDEDKIFFNIFTATNFTEAISLLNEKGIKGGIYFLDIELNTENTSKNGFDLAEQIKQLDPRAQLIFITSYADLSIITFKRRLGPIDYIVKTNDLDAMKQRITETLDVAINQLKHSQQLEKLTFSYTIGKKIININMDQVIYLETDFLPHRLILVTKTGKATFPGSIKEYGNNNPYLEKISQSCLVNPQNITAIDLTQRLISFINGDILTFSVSSKRKIKQLLTKYNYQRENISKTD